MNAATGGKFPLGTKVFAKMKGFPPWPAQVVESTEAYPKAKPAKHKKQQFVRFYKTNDVAWVAEVDLESFEEKLDEYRRMSALKGGRQSNDLRQAIADAEADQDGISSGSPTQSTSNFAQQDSADVGESASFVASSQTPLDSKQDLPDNNSLTIDTEGSPTAKLAPVRAMRELLPNTSSADASGGAPQTGQRITITLNKDSSGKGVQTVTASGGGQKGMVKRGDKRTLGTANSSPPSSTVEAPAAGTPKRSRAADAGEKPTTRGKSAVKPTPLVVDSVWAQDTTADTLRSTSNSTRGMPHSLAAEHQTGVTSRYGFFGLASDAILSAVAEKIASMGNKKVIVNVYMPTSFDQKHARRGTPRSTAHDAKSVDVLFSESEVVFLAPPTEADLKNLFEGDETHQLRRCVKAGGATKAVVLFGLFDPTLVKHVADLMSGKQVEVLELAPVGGNAANATQGDMVFCASGATDVLRRIGEFFNAAGRTVFNTGATSGAAIRLAGLFAAFEAITTTALVEVLHDAKHLEVNPTRLLELIATQGAASTTCTSQAHQFMSDPPGVTQAATRSLDERLNVMRRILAPFRAQEFMLSQAHCVIRNMFAAFQPEKVATTVVTRQPSQQQPPQHVSNPPPNVESNSSSSHSASAAKSQNTNNNNNNSGAVTKVEPAVPDNASAVIVPAAAHNRPAPQHKHGTRAAAAAGNGNGKNAHDAAGNGGDSTSSASSSIISSAGGTTPKAAVAAGGEHRGRGRPRKSQQNTDAGESTPPTAETSVHEQSESNTVQQANDTLDSDVFDMTTMNDADEAENATDNTTTTTTTTSKPNDADKPADRANGLQTPRTAAEEKVVAPQQQQAAETMHRLGDARDAAGKEHVSRHADSGEPNAKRHRTFAQNGGGRSADDSARRNQSGNAAAAAAVAPTATAMATRRSPHGAHAENSHHVANSTAAGGTTTKNVSNDSAKQHRAATNSNSHGAVSSSNTAHTVVLQKTIREPSDNKRVNSGVAVNGGGGTLSSVVAPATTQQ